MLIATLLAAAFPLAGRAQPGPAEGDPPTTAKVTGPVATMPPESKDAHDARMRWWREARFGLFIHWGIYSVTAGVYHDREIPKLGEWIMWNARIPVDDYAKFAAAFNPVKFNADDWVALAKNAGMKYIVITAKHHDGFAMFHSADPFNIVDATPFHRDPLKELSAACERAGIRLGIYYSQAQDWHHPGGAVPPGPVGRWDPAKQNGDYDRYIEQVALPQMKELLTNYGKVSILFFDTPVKFTKERAEKFIPLLKLQPGIIVNERLQTGFQGDVANPEQRVPPTGLYDDQGARRDWETCMTMNDTWGYKSTDHNWKSAQTLLRNLVDIASKGGNYLLNVGPTSQGVFPPESIDRLNVIGAWLRTNGDAIYGSGPTPFGPEAGSFSPTEKDAQGQPLWIPAWHFRCTTKPGKVFVHLLEWPAGGSIELPSPASKVTRAYLLADPAHQPLSLSTTADRIVISLPKSAPDPIISVICLELQDAR
jgi:alpha-L-fucosidase